MSSSLGLLFDCIMKLLVVLCAFAACAAAAPQYGYTYSALAPVASYPQTYSYYGPYASPYAYPHISAPVVVKDASVAAPAVAPVIPHVVKSQYHMQDEFGQVRYGFSEPHHTQEVARDAAGNQVGSFSYINPEGKVVRTDFVADALGYRVASNDLPVAPVDLPVPVQDTPEVAEAKAKFFEEFEKTKTRSRRDVSVLTPASTTPLATPVVAPVMPKAIIPAAVAPFTYPQVTPLAYNAPIMPYNPYYSYPYSYNYNPYYSGLVYSQ